MEIKYEENKSLNCQEMSISFHPRNKEIAHSLMQLAKTMLGDIEVFDDCHNHYNISIISIYYIEVIEHKIFLYTKEKVYQRSDTFKSMKKRLNEHPFFQVNARTLVNKGHVLSYRVVEDCRRIVTLDNGEQIVVNRNYKNELTKNSIVKLKY